LAKQNEKKIVIEKRNGRMDNGEVWKSHPLVPSEPYNLQHV
jgi:hypothetical protein